MHATDNRVQIGYVVSKRMSYTETAYLADYDGTRRTNDKGKAWVYVNVTDAIFAAETQLSTQWKVNPAYQEW